MVFSLTLNNYYSLISTNDFNIALILILEKLHKSRGIVISKRDHTKYQLWILLGKMFVATHTKNQITIMENQNKYQWKLN